MSKSERRRGRLRVFQQFSRLLQERGAVQRCRETRPAASGCTPGVPADVWLESDPLQMRFRPPSGGLSVTRPVVAVLPPLARSGRGRASPQLLPWRHIMLTIAQKCFSTSQWKLMRSSLRGPSANERFQVHQVVKMEGGLRTGGGGLRGGLSDRRATPREEQKVQWEE